MVKPTKIYHWKNGSNVLDRYVNTSNENKASFVWLNIKRIYLSTTSDLLHNSIQFAQEITTVSDNDIRIIMQPRKTLFFNQKKPWVKR